MKKITSLIMLMLFSLVGYGQVMNTGFETGFPSGWQELHEGTGSSEWAVLNVPVLAYEGSSCASVTPSSAVGQPNAVKDWLITSAIDLNGIINPKINFYGKANAGPNANSVLEVRVSTTDTAPESFGDLITFYQDYNTNAPNPISAVGGQYGLNELSLLPYAGQTIYVAFVVVNEGTGKAWYLDNISVYEDCPEPTQNAIGDISATTATASWLNPMNVPSFEIDVMLASENPSSFTADYISTTTSQVFSDLLPNTQYKYYIRAICGPEAASEWIGPFVFGTTPVPANLPYDENFESYHGWQFINGTQLNKWYVGTAVHNGGLNSMYISNNDGVSNIYSTNSNSVTQSYRDIVIPTGVNEIEVTFDWRAVGEGSWDYMRVWLVPSTFTPTAGTQISVANSGGVQLGGNLNQTPDWITSNFVVNASAFAGSTGRLIFEWRNDGSGGTQPPAAVDNIHIKQITCSAPSNLVLGAVTQNSAIISWTAPANAPTSYDYFVSQVNVAPDENTQPTDTVTETTVSLSDLEPGQVYYVWVRSNCGTVNGNSFLIGPIVINTIQIPAQLPYTENFDETGVVFGLNNGQQVNKWMVGSDTFLSADKSLYISNNNATNSYATNNSSIVQAYRDIFIPENSNEILVSFDWKCVGEGSETFSWDYVRVWLVPSTFTPTPGVSISVANSGGMLVGGDFSNQPNWVNFTSIINVSAFSNSTRRLVFEWRNDGSGGTQPPGAIDNILVKAVTCSAPSNLVLDSVGQNTAQLSWTAPLNTVPASYDYYVSSSATPPTDATVPTGNVADTTVTIDGLLPGQTYFFWVRGNCGDDGTSILLGPLSFFTSQVPAELNFFDGFEGDSGFTLSNNNNLPNKWIIGNAVSASGNKSLYISNNGVDFQYTTDTQLTVVHAFRDIAIPAGMTTDLAVSFDWRNQGELNSDYMRVWIVPITYTPTVGTSINATSGGAQLGGNFQLNNVWSNQVFVLPGNTYEGQTIRLVFEWRNDTWSGMQSPAAIDNVEVKALTCSAPIDLKALSGINGTLNLSWTPVGTETQWELVIQPTATGSPGDAPTTSVIVTGNPTYNFTPVEGEMYEFYVRAICSDTDKSFWTGPFQFSIFKPDACADLDITPLDLNVNENGDYIVCDGESVTIELNANYNQNAFKATTSYEIEAIEYNPPFPFLGGIEMPIDSDDEYTASFDLPFAFCFFGQEYTYCRVGDNGVITFGLPYTTNFGEYCPWSFSGPIPNTNFPIKNAIYGVYQDLFTTNNPGPNSQINYQVLGTYPCRALVVNFNEVPAFGTACVGEQYRMTTQIVLYEITNIIEVYVKKREACNGWQNGLGVLGIQNAAGTVAYTPPGRNTGDWDAEEEAWRFSPSGATTPTFGWYQDGVLISENPQYTVEINDDTNFEAVISYPGCGDDDLVLRKSFDIKISEEIILPQAGEIVICMDNLEDPNRGRINDNDEVILSNLTNPGSFNMTYYHTEADAEAGTNQIVDAENYIPSSFPETIFVRVQNIVTGCFGTTSFNVREGILPIFGVQDQTICTNYTFPELLPNEKYVMYEVLDPINHNLVTDVVNNPTKDTILDIGFYKIYVEVESVDKCVDVFSYKVFVLPCSIPKGISPNGDGKNDYLDLTYYLVQDLKIFNRYGKEVYSHGAGYTNQWHGQSNNGGELPSGTYFYNIVTPYEHFTGWIQLVREQN